MMNVALFLHACIQCLLCAIVWFSASENRRRTNGSGSSCWVSCLPHVWHGRNSEAGSDLGKRWRGDSCLWTKVYDAQLRFAALFSGWGGRQWSIQMHSDKQSGICLKRLHAVRSRYLLTSFNHPVTLQYNYGDIFQSQVDVLLNSDLPHILTWIWNRCGSSSTSILPFD